MSFLKLREGRINLGFFFSLPYVVIAVLVYFLTSAGLLWAILWPIWLVIKLFHLIFG
ncbi:MAG: hypothetical protein LBR53_06225 [Deltaproteobacteria bacterium]|jgi:hypothetical protein|nr:hypothetical protein [Deltaproteobacteria bacterium]